MFRVKYKCGEEYRHDESHVGLKFKCSRCGKLHKVKQPSKRGGESLWIRFKKSILRFFGKFQLKQKNLKPRNKFVFDEFNSPSKVEESNHRLNIKSNHEKVVLKLATQAWESSENKTQKGFVLNLQTNETLTLEQTVGKMLDHARKVAPGLEVPLLTPKVEKSSTEDQSAGCFQVDEDGFASIKVDERFVNDRRSTLAILSHEICHYILENSGIRESNTDENEMQTDICMFVIGFGELFLKGYKCDLAMSDYRRGHKLGYLEEQDYWNIDKFVRKLRSENDRTLNLPSENEKLKLIISRMVMGDQRIVDRYISSYKKKFSQLSEKDRLEKIIRDIQR